MLLRFLFLGGRVPAAEDCHELLRFTKKPDDFRPALEFGLPIVIEAVTVGISLWFIRRSVAFDRALVGRPGLREIAPAIIAR